LDNLLPPGVLAEALRSLPAARPGCAWGPHRRCRAKGTCDPETYKGCVQLVINGKRFGFGQITVEVPPQPPEEEEKKEKEEEEEDDEEAEEEDGGSAKGRAVRCPVCFHQKKACGLAWSPKGCAYRPPGPRIPNPNLGRKKAAGEARRASEAARQKARTKLY
jgi:hypothetical protein